VAFCFIYIRRIGYISLDLDYTIIELEYIKIDFINSFIFALLLPFKCRNFANPAFKYGRAKWNNHD
jgi:hypothetical protein